MRRSYWNVVLSPSPVENLLANHPVRSNRLKIFKPTNFVPKKTKVIQTDKGEQAEPGVSSTGAKIDNVKIRRTSTSGKNGKPARKKKSSAGKTATFKQQSKGRKAEPPDEEIRLRAYFISERRRRFGLPGDASSDWLEAKRQLLSDSSPR
jgi:hypothetical protein